MVVVICNEILMIVIRDYGTHVKVFNLKKRGLLGLIFAYALNGVNA